MTIERIPLNVNRFVFVKLTIKGRNIARSSYRLHPTGDDGYTRFQLWELMQLFGQHLYNGATELPFELPIMLESDGLTQQATESPDPAGSSPVQSDSPSVQA